MSLFNRFRNETIIGCFYFFSLFFNRNAILSLKHLFYFFQRPFGGLGTTYDVYRMSITRIRKRVMDFTLVLIELFSLGVTVEALRAKNTENRRFLCNAVLFQHFRYKGSPPTNIFCTLSHANGCLTTLPLTVHTKKLCSRLSSSEVRFYTEIGRFVFLRPPLGDLGAT